jgi:hypothetical protein
MKPHSRAPEQADLLHPRLVDMIDPHHELVNLAALIDWDFFEREWSGFFPSADRPSGNVAAPGRRADVSAARLQPVG